MPGNFYMGPLPGAPVPTTFLPLQEFRDENARTQRLNDMVNQLQGDVQAVTAPSRLNDMATQLQGDVQAITNPGASVPATAPAVQARPINYGPPMQRAATPQFESSVFGDQSGPIRYTSDGGTSTVTGGYGDRSQLADWGLARFFGQDNPAQMAQRNATARTMAARNSTEYQNVYQTMLRQTGNPLVASAQADALFAEQMPNYAGDFINSGQDVNTQQRFDQGLARLNAAAAINPELGEDVYRSNLPVWGTYAGGVSPTGESVTVTPDGSTTQMPGAGYSPSLLNGLTGATGGRSASAKADPNQLTAYQRMQLLQGSERNQQSRISNLNSTLTNLYAQLNNNQRNGGNPAYEQSLLGQITAVQTQLNQLSGLSAPAQPVITNSNTGSK